MVTTLERLAEKREIEATVAQQEPIETVTYKLRYLDASDAKKVLDRQLTGRGKITVMRIEPQRGWKARGGYGGTFTRVERESGARTRANMLVITDTQSNVRTILETVKKIDVKPQQVLIEARIMEVNRDHLKDIGIDWGTGSDITDGAINMESVEHKGKSGIIGLSSQIAPANFNPEAEIADDWAFDSGLSLIYQRLSNVQFEVLIHALEEDVDSNTLSAPRIITLDGQEAYIMVGERRPIIESDLQSSDTTVGISKDLSYYQSLGIELNVVPQVCSDNTILMTLYPSITSSTQDVTATSQISSGGTTAESSDDFPIILVREVQTQVLVDDGETIVIGGLLQDVKSQAIFKVPILGDIPFLGLLFQRRTYDIDKIDLIIFLTAHILKEAEYTPERIASLEDRLDTVPPKWKKKR